MLTKEVIEYVNAINVFDYQIHELVKDKSDLEQLIKNLINYKDDNSFIIGFSIAETPHGYYHDDETYVDEHCSDSLYCPDGGYGTQYFPIEDGLWLAVHYEY
jgi:hypothetical protein